MTPTLHISLLGDFLLISGDTPVTTVNFPRVQSFLAYLVLHRYAPQGRSRLAFLLWPDSTEAQAHTNLRKLLYQLRQAFPDIDHFLHVDKQSLQWRSASSGGSCTLDIQEIEQASALAVQAEQDQNVTALRHALERVTQLYRGDLLPSCYEEWILAERDRLRQLFLSSVQRLIALLEQERDYTAAIAAALLLLRQDPLHEATYRQLMRLYALQGERAAALRTYHTCARMLERELETEPGELTQALYMSLRRSDRTPETGASAGPLMKQRAVPLQGRKMEWRRLQNAWNNATGGIASLQTGSPQIVILTGEAGIGKTRLARELEVWVSRLGMMAVSACCYAPLGHLAYAPVTSWLRSEPFQTSLSRLDPTTLTEIARLVPEVLVTQPHLSPPTAMTEGWQRQPFFAALAHALLSARQPLLLLLDDLQWCDQETLHWLQYLFHFAPDARLLLVGTVRVEETSPTHPLVVFLETLQRDGLVTEIPLGPLTLTETTSLAECIVGSQLAPAMGDMLYRETEGNPFFVVEMLQAGTLSKDTSRQPDTQSLLPLLTYAASPLPSSMQAVLATRLAQLSAQAHAVANIAAVIGREFSFSVLVQASGESEEHMMQGLDELWQRRMVREHDAGTPNAYDFSHNKIREHIYTSLSPVRRRFLHQRVASAFQAVYRLEDQDGVCGQIAVHYERAGFPAQAIPFYQQAGKVASRIYAHPEALHAFERAVALIEADQVSLSIVWKIAVQAYVSLGDVLTEIGSYEAARQAYQRAMTYLPAPASIWQARLYWKIATTWLYAAARNDDTFHVNSRMAFEAAERILMQSVDPANQDWRDEWIALQFAHIWKGSVSDMEVAIEKARPIVEQYGTQEQRKLLAEAIGIHSAMRDRYVLSASKVAAWRARIAALEPTENMAQRGQFLAVLGIGLLCAAQFDEAEEQLRDALYMGECTGNAWLQNTCLMFLPFVFRQRGQMEEMRRILAHAQSVGVAQDNRILSGHSAWVAWREGNLALAEHYGRESIQEEQYRRIRPNPFLWTGRWPLIGVALAQHQTSVAINNVRLLFDPTQQPPPEPLDALLETLLHAWDAGEQEDAHILLQQAARLAEQMGYL